MALADLGPIDDRSSTRTRQWLKPLSSHVAGWRRGEREAERTPLANFALDPDIASVELNQSLADGEPQTDAGGRAGTGVVDPVELLEQVLNVVGGDAGALVADV